MGHYLLALPTPMEPERVYEHVSAVGEQHGNEDAAMLDRYLFDGDTNALVALYDKHNHRLYMYCLKLLGTAEQAEDLTQELWERVARLRSRPQHILNPAGFFMRIARNLCLNQLKARKRISPLEDIGEGMLPSFTPHEPTELEDLALRALDELPHDYREVLILSLYCGYRLDEIAELQGKSADAIRKRASRARVYLRERLVAIIKEQGEDPDLVFSRNGIGPEAL